MAYKRIDILEEEIKKFNFNLNSLKLYVSMKYIYKLRLIILEGVNSRFKYYVMLFVERMKELNKLNTR